jgi:hypothetical protein
MARSFQRRGDEISAEYFRWRRASEKAAASMTPERFLLAGRSAEIHIQAEQSLRGCEGAADRHGDCPIVASFDILLKFGAQRVRHIASAQHN